MAIIKFELKENHLKLLKHLKWGLDDTTNAIFTNVENRTPYGGLSLVEDAGLILFGKIDDDFDPLSPYGPQYSKDQKEEIDLLYSELPTALEIVLYLGTFEPGHYKTKYHTVNWVKYTPK